MWISARRWPALTKAWKTSRSDGTGAKARESSCSDAALKGRSSTLAPTLTPSLDDVTVEERDDVTVEERRFSAALQSVTKLAALNERCSGFPDIAFCVSGSGTNECGGYDT